MSSAKITLVGMSNYMNTAGDDLFKFLKIPTGIDKDTLIGSIIVKGAEFEVLYSDPYFMQQVIGSWSKKWYTTFSKWVKALSIDYNPLENYDRMEEYTDNESGTTSNTGTLHSTSNGTSTDISNGTGSSDTTNTVSAFNSERYEPNNMSSVSTTNGTEGKTELQNVGDNKTTDDGQHASTSKHVGRVHGNIGVTTSQQMLQAELDIATWNIYEHITDMFLADFIIPIY